MQALQGSMAAMDEGEGIAGNGLLSNLIAYWGLDEAAGANNALDKHSNGLTLTQVGSPGSAAGKVYAGARTINGSNQLFQRSSEALLQAGSGSFGVAAWVYWDGSNNRGWFGKYTSAQGEYWGVFYKATGTPYPQFQFRNAANTGTVTAAAPAISANTWAFIVCWYDHDGGTANIQIDDGTVYATNCGSVGMRNFSDTFRIGTYYNATEGIKGKVQSACIWKGAVLSTTQRTALYNAGAGLAYEAFTN